jgi:hypothetical protein
MKSSKISFAILSSVLALSLSAQADLKAEMKQIGSLFKALNAQANDATQDADSAAKCDQLVQLFTQAKAETPDTVAALPADQQANAEANFQAGIQKEIDDATALAAAFRANDQGQITTLLADMLQTKKDGHQTFNPPPPAGN